MENESERVRGERMRGVETGGEWRMRVRDRGGDRWGVENESER